MNIPVRAVDMTGQQFGRLTVVAYSGPDKKNKGSSWLCRCECKVERVFRRTDLLQGKHKSCGCYRRERQWMKSPSTGLPFITKQGYVLVYQPSNPMASKGGYVQEHRLVMSEMLGRPLLPNENVHHKNGIRDDNRPENLELWVKSQPCGQRIEDRLAWARDFIAQYG